MQPKLFESRRETATIEDILLYALGDFQSRGKTLANRELAFDRLRGAFLRAFAKFGIPELSDEEIVKGLRNLGVEVTKVPNFVAKHPFRLIVSKETCFAATAYFAQRSPENDLNLAVLS